MSNTLMMNSRSSKIGKKRSDLLKFPLATGMDTRNNKLKCLIKIRESNPKRQALTRKDLKNSQCLDFAKWKVWQSYPKMKLNITRNRWLRSNLSPISTINFKRIHYCKAPYLQVLIRTELTIIQIKQEICQRNDLKNLRNNLTLPCTVCQESNQREHHNIQKIEEEETCWQVTRSTLSDAVSTSKTYH